MEIQNKKLTNARLDKAWTSIVGPDGIMGPEEQILLGLIAKVIAVALVIVTLAVLAFSYFIVGPYLVEPAIAILNIILRDLTEGRFFIPFGIKVLAGKIGALLIIITIGVLGFRKMRKSSIDPTVSTHALKAESMVSPRKDMVPMNCVGVPVFIGKPRDWWIYEPTTFIASPLNSFEVIAIEAISRTLDLGVRNITSKDGVRCVGRFSIVFQVYDYYTAALVDISPNSNLYAHLIDILGAHARTAVNSLKYDKIDRGNGVKKKEQVNKAIMQVLSAEYGDPMPDPRVRTYASGSGNSSHKVIQVGFLGVYIYGVVCQELVADDADFQKARESKLRVAAEVKAQQKLIEKLSAMPGYADLKAKQLVDQANLMLDRYNNEYFFDFGSEDAGMLDKLLAGIIAKFGGK